VIGDIHGCADELQALLDRAGLSEDDEIISVGDFIDRGPDSPAVLGFFASHPSARAVLGNHELKHLRWRRGELRPALSQLITQRQFGDSYDEACAYLETLPLWLELPHARVVHGCIEPGVPLRAQERSVLAGTMSGTKRLAESYDRPWYELYDDPKPVIVGHEMYREDGQPFVYEDRVFALDTRCCHGLRLTGLLLPEFRFVSVPARADHWSSALRVHADLRYAGAGVEALDWGAAREVLAALDRFGTGADCERRSELETLLERAERALRGLHEEILAVHRSVLDELIPRGYAAMEPSDQARLYGRAVRSHPLASYLHQLRKGEMTLDTLRRRFKRPADVLASFTSRERWTGGRSRPNLR
jgi:hypothetical protein